MLIKFKIQFLNMLKVTTIWQRKDNNIKLHVAMIEIMNKGRTLQRDTREISK